MPDFLVKIGRVFFPRHSYKYQYIGKIRGKLKTNAKYLVGGYDKDNLTLCSLSSQSSRINRNVKKHECKFLSYNRFAFG